MKLTNGFLCLLVAAPLFAACSSSTTDQTTSPAVKPALGPYPDGPYGNAEGEILTNLKLQGYLNKPGVEISNTLPFVDSYSLEDVRKTGAKYALVHVSEFF